MADAKLTIHMSVEMLDAGPLGPPLHVGFVEAIQVADDVQLTLCDVDMKELMHQVAAWRGGDTGKPLDLHLKATPMQRIFLSKLAITPLLLALQQAAKNLSGAGDETGGTPQ